MKSLLNMTNKLIIAVLLFLGMSINSGVRATPMMDVITELQLDWARGYYAISDEQKSSYFESLQAKAHEVSVRFSGKAEPLILEGMITSTHGKYQGLHSADASAKLARDLLLAAEKIDSNALDGAALTWLGALYYKTPRRISFGDHAKAREYLERSLKVNPSGIDQNFFMGDFLAVTGEKIKAIEYLKKALAAPARPGREEADTGRRGEIQKLLDRLVK